MATGKTEIVSVHKLRRRARREERRIQAAFDRGLRDHQFAWATGVRVRKAGRLQYVVELTDWRGH